MEILHNAVAWLGYGAVVGISSAGVIWLIGLAVSSMLKELKS